VAIVEAMVAGLPVVSTDVWGIPEAVVHGETGIIHAPGDQDALAAALIALLNDRARARALGLAGRTRALTRFSRDVLVGQTRAIWEGVAQSAREKPTSRTAGRQPPSS
jgi:glycosyltransferase involved in cell wall biosynthesis